MPYALIQNGNIITLMDGNFPGLTIGLDADKSSNPAVFNTHIATDTMKTYTCYVAGTWSLSNSSTSTKYSNHLGNVDNVMYTDVTGNATATENKTLHRMDLVGSNGGVTGRARYIINIPINLNTSMFFFNGIVQNIVNGEDIDLKQTKIGLVDLANTEHAIFNQKSIGSTWACESLGGGNTASTPISALVNGDSLTIIGQQNRLIYLVNGLVVASHTNNINLTASYPMFMCGSTQATERAISCDYISIEVFK